ncbi:hypothetical protein Q9L41_18750 [Vibrio cholerae]|uniref:hypothetical protein n=1 Tax=Vibrio cholerae TaxID=666 RepID=UPI00273A4C91|nr:hypothetical protein [Vibrio cholerae]MDP4497824.1 hypothetical protein [Vibrio cholerae]
MSTAFEVDNHIATLFSTQVPLLDGLYDLTPDQVLLDQAAHESEVRSYPRRIPIAINKPMAAWWRYAWADFLGLLSRCRYFGAWL